MSARKKTAAAVIQPAKPNGPPYAMTADEETEMLARHRFKADDVATETEKCGSVLDDIAYEVEGLGEAITHAINDVSHDNAQDARLMADALLSFARSLGDVSARMMRYAGRLEAYRDAQGRAEKPEEMVEAWKCGGLGNPPPPVDVWRTVRRRSEGAGKREVTP